MKTDVKPGDIFLSFVDSSIYIVLTHPFYSSRTHSTFVIAWRNFAYVDPYSTVEEWIRSGSRKIA